MLVPCLPSPCFCRHLSAIRINEQRQQPNPAYGHLLEFDGDRATLGVDPVVWPDRSGATD